METKKPNIIFITTDQQRYDALGINGNSILQTPFLDKLAARGMNFTKAYSTCPVCIPARRTWYTGLHPSTHGMVSYQDGVDFDPPATLPGVLKENGYQTQLVGKMHLHPQGKRYGFDHVILSESPNHRPDSPYQARNDYCRWLEGQGLSGALMHRYGVLSNDRTARAFEEDSRLHHSSWVTEQAVKFIMEDRDPTCPFFMHLSYLAPHPPFLPPQQYFDYYMRQSEDFDVKLGNWVGNWEPRKGRPADAGRGPFIKKEMQEACAGYYGLIQHVDDQISFFFNKLFGYATGREKDPLIVVFTSDHGEMLGDHHLFRKSLPYEGSAHVPFFICTFNMDTAKGTSDELACLEDVFPTILDLAGVDAPSHLGEHDGRSLAPILRGEKPTARESLHVEFGTGCPFNSVVDQRYKYIWFADTQEEQLFDLQEDPNELNDLSGQTERLAPYRDELEKFLAGRPEQNHWTEPDAIKTFDRKQLKPLDNSCPSMMQNAFQT